MIEKNNFNKLSSSHVLSISGLKSYKEKPNEKYMNESQLLHFKKVLEIWRQKLEHKIQNTVSYMKNESVNFPDLIDRAMQEEEFNLELYNRNREYKLIKKIENNLKKIKSNTFGFCDSCGVEIGINRLEVNPIADLCIDCQTLAEIREKQVSN